MRVLCSAIVLSTPAPTLATVTNGSTGAADQWGRTVTRIRFVCDAQLASADFSEEITQKLGQPLEPSRVNESLKKLYATGRFVELRADVEPHEDGVELVFVSRAAFFTGLVRVEGVPKDVDPRTLIDASRLKLGQTLTEDDLTEAARRIQATLAENGYYGARIKLRPNRDLENEESEVVFRIAPGSPARLSGVEFEGKGVDSPAQLAARAGWIPGAHLSSGRIQRGVARIHKSYLARDRLQSVVSVESRDYDPGSNSEKLRVRAEAGPLVRVRVEGARISRSKLRELLPAFKEGGLDDDTLARGEKILEDYLQRHGYFTAYVKAERVKPSDPQTLQIIYHVRPGVQGEFAGYNFRGNRGVPTVDLVAAITGRSPATVPGAAPYSTELLARHVDTLLSLYHARGFLQARVEPILVNDEKLQPPELSVFFEIKEGPITNVGRLVLKGAGQETEKALWPLLTAKPGEPYSPERVQADRGRILGFYADRGYARAEVSSQASPSALPYQVDLEYRIAPNQQERIQRVVVLGDEHTRESLIRRELALRRDDPLRQSDIVESQRRLYDLGIFNHVQIATQDTQSLATPRTVLVQVEEARRWTLGYGGGVEVQRLGSNQPQGQLKASPRLSLDLTRLNVGGRAQTFSMRGRISTLDLGGAVSYLISPLPVRRDLRFRISALVDRSRDVLTFTENRKEAAFSAEKHYGPESVLLGRFSFREVKVDPCTLRISPEAIPLLSRPARVAMVAGSYVLDRRDDPTDASAGSYSLADAGVSWDRFGSESNFIRFAGQNATYYRLAPHLVFARNTRFEAESPFGGLMKSFISVCGQPGEFVLTRDIPLPERFFMGGSESHRGFSINQAGPRDLETGFPIGGDSLFFNSLELRMPLLENRLGLVVFHDAGNVYSTLARMRLLKVTQGPPTDFDYTVHALGLGARYKTPLGPVRFDVGYDMNPPRFQVKVTNGLEVRRLSQFQFFLSIGQSF